MRRTFALMVLALVGLTATPAGAAGRTPFEPIPPGGFEFPAGSLCSFGLKVEPVVSREYMMTLPDGSVLITGALFIRLTNTDTDEHRVVNISGPSRISADGSTSIALGPLMQPFFEDIPALILFHGRTVLHIAPDGSATLVSQHGTMQDACDVVA